MAEQTEWEPSESEIQAAGQMLGGLGGYEATGGKSPTRGEVIRRLKANHAAREAAQANPSSPSSPEAQPGC